MRSVLASLSVSLALVAQDPARKRPTFHLPAGDYTLAQLLQQAELAVRAPLRAASDTTDVAPIRLQTDLALPEQAWADVLGALLTTRDVVLVRAPGGTGLEAAAVPARNVGWLRERAVECTLAELDTRRALAGPVRVVVPTRLPPQVVTNQLQPYLAGTTRVIASDAVDGGVAFIGLADTVRFAVGQVASLDPALPTNLGAAAAPAWPRASSGRSHRLAAGAYTEVQVVDALAKALRRNIVLAQDVTREPRELVVTAAIEGDELRFEDQLTALLDRAGLLILEVSAPDALYEAVRTGPPRWTEATRTQPVRSDELLARPGWIAWVAVAVAGRDGGGALTQAQMFAELRNVAGRGGSLTAMSQRDGGLLVTGLSTDVTLVLERFATAAAAAAAADPVPAGKGTGRS